MSDAYNAGKSAGIREAADAIRADAVNGDISPGAAQWALDTVLALLDDAPSPAGVTVQNVSWSEEVEKGVTYYKAEGFCIHKVVDRFNTGMSWVCHWPNYSQRRWCKTLDEAKETALRALSGVTRW